MSNQSLDDIQQTIDKLFRKLDGATSGGEITQTNHALRVQITKKKQLGGALSGREQEMVAAVGEISGKKKGGAMGMVIVVVVLAVGAYLAYRIFIKHG